MATVRTALGSMDDDWSRVNRRILESMKPIIQAQEMMKSFNSNWISQIQAVQRSMLPTLAIDNYIRQQTSQIQSIVNTALSSQVRSISAGIANVLNSTMQQYQFKIIDSIRPAILQASQIDKLAEVARLSLSIHIPQISSNILSAAVKQIDFDMSPLANAFKNI